jgi:hypothetical protein
MVAMTAVVVLGVIALIVAILAWVTWRRGADERQSVQHHQHTLETLRHVADRRQQSGRLASGRRGPSSKTPSPSRPSVMPGPRSPYVEGESLRSGNGAASTRPTATASRRGGSALPSPRNSGLVEAGPGPAGAALPSRAPRPSAKGLAHRRETTAIADDMPGGAPAAIAPSAARRMGGQLPGAAEQARRDGRARVRRTRLAVAVGVLAIGGVVGGVLASGRAPNPTRAKSARSHLSHPMTSPGHSPAPTAAASPSALAPTAPTAFSATYAAPSSAYTVVISASAQCWVMATDPSTGHVVWTGTIAGGQSHALSVSSDLTVQLGAPSDASVTMNGQDVQFPTGFRSPFSLSFQAGS